MSALTKDPVIVSLLDTAYSPQTSEAILAYMGDFEVFSDGFLPVTPTVAENNGVRLILMRCPLALEYLGTGGDPRVVLGVLFTPHFPTKPPVCAVLLDQGSGLQLPDAPWLSKASGSIKLPLLPDLDMPSNGAAPALIDVLLAVTGALTQCQITRGASPPPPPGGVPSPTASAASHGAPSPPPAGPPPPPPVSNGSLAASPSRPSNIPLAAEIAVRDAMDKSVGEFARQYDVAEQRLSELEESKATLDQLGRSLADKEATLRAVIEKLERANAALDRAAEAQAEEDDPLAALEAPDALRAQAVELLSEVLAYDDLLELYERRLRKGTIKGAAAYTRLVGDAARHQFLAKYKLKKVHGAATAKQSFQSLVQRFPGVDQADIASVLAECRFSLAEAARHLTEMSRMV